MLELLDHSLVVFGAQQVLELSQYALVLSGIELHILFGLEVLDLEEQL
jgi:hypothetical protein